MHLHDINTLFNLQGVTIKNISEPLDGGTVKHAGTLFKVLYTSGKRFIQRLLIIISVALLILLLKEEIIKLKHSSVEATS